MTISQNPIHVFLSYAEEDEPHLQTLKTHLSMLKWQGLISTWDARQIVPGTNRAAVTDKQFEQASIILLLVSADFLASDYCYQVEMKRAMARHEAGEARVIPIVVRPCDWRHGPLAILQSLPRDGKAITTWDDRDLAWKDVTVGIRRTIEDLRQGNARAQPHQEMGSRSTSAPSVDRSYVTYDRQPRPNGSSFTRDAQHVGTLLHTLGYHTGEVYSLAWSPDGCYLASAGVDKTIFITERATQRVFQLPPEHTKTISSLAWSPDGTFLGSGGQDGFIHIWDVVARRKLWTYHGHRDPARWRATLIGQSQIFSLSWSPDGRFIASGGDDAIAHVWKALSGETYYQYRGHAAGQDEAGFHAAVAISSVAWSPDGSRLATASCKISDKLEQDLFFNALRSIPGISDFVAWNEYAKIHVWDALTGEHVLIYPHHKIGVTALAWSPDSTYIASAGKDKTVHVWKPGALCSPTRFTQNAFSGHTDQVKAVVWSPDGTSIASAGKDCTVQVWKVSTGERIYTYRGHTKCVRALAWSPDGTSLASAGDEKTIHIWRAP